MARKIIEDMFAPLASPMMPQALSAPSGEAAARFVRTALAHLPIEKLQRLVPKHEGQQTPVVGRSD